MHSDIDGSPRGRSPAPEGEGGRRRCPCERHADEIEQLRAHPPSPAPPGFDRWACTMTRLDTGEAYTVCQTLTGAWACTCRDATFRARKESRRCKHMEAGRRLKALLDLMTMTHRRSHRDHDQDH